MNSKGRLVEVCNKRSGTSASTGKDWKSITFVITTDDQYNPNMAFTTANLVDVIENTPIGTELDVEWKGGSRKYKETWYSEFKAFKVTKIGDAPLTSDTPSGNEPLPF